MSDSHGHVLIPYGSENKRVKGWQGCSVGKSTCCTDRWPEFKTQTPPWKRGRKEPTPVRCCLCLSLLLSSCFPPLFSPSLSLLPTPTVNQSNKTFKNYTSPHVLASKRCKEAFQGQTGSSHGYSLQARENELISKGKCLLQKLCHCLINVFFPTLFNHFLLK